MGKASGRKIVTGALTSVLCLLSICPAFASSVRLCDTIIVEDDIVTFAKLDFAAILARHGLGADLTRDTGCYVLNSKVEKCSLDSFRDAYPEIIVALRNVADEHDRMYLQSYCLAIGVDAGLEISNTDLLSASSRLRASADNLTYVSRMNNLFGRSTTVSEGLGLLCGFSLGGKIVSGKPRDYYRGGATIGLDLGLSFGRLRTWTGVAHEAGKIHGAGSVRYYSQVDSVLSIPDYDKARIWSVSLACGWEVHRQGRLVVMPYVSCDWFSPDFGGLNDNYVGSKRLLGIGVEAEICVGRVERNSSESIFMGLGKYEQTTLVRYLLGLRFQFTKFDYDSNRLGVGNSFALTLTVKGIICGTAQKTSLLEIEK